MIIRPTNYRHLFRTWATAGPKLTATTAVIALGLSACGDRWQAATHDAVPVPPSPTAFSSDEARDSDRIRTHDSVPVPDRPVSEILDDPAMDDVDEIIRGGVDPRSLDFYAATETRYIEDLDRNIAGHDFRAEQLGVEIATDGVTYLVAAGVVRNEGGLPVSSGVFARHTRSGTTEILDQAIEPLENCGTTAPELIRSDNPDPADLVLVCSNGTELHVNATTIPPAVSPG